METIYSEETHYYRECYNACFLDLKEANKKGKLEEGIKWFRGIEKRMGEKGEYQAAMAIRDAIKNYESEMKNKELLKKQPKLL